MYVCVWMSLCGSHLKFDTLAYSQSSLSLFLSLFASVSLVQSKRRARAGGKDLSDAPELDRNNVSFELPDELFNKTFRTVTQVSQAFSRLIMVSCISIYGLKIEIPNSENDYDCQKAVTEL